MYELRWIDGNENRWENVFTINGVIMKIERLNECGIESVTVTKIED